MALKPEASFGAVLALVVLDMGIYQLHMPNTADIKSTMPYSSPINSSRSAATWTALGATAALSLLAKDPNLFIFGGGFAVALDWYYRHANAVHPATGQVVLPPSGSSYAAEQVSGS